MQASSCSAADAGIGAPSSGLAAAAAAGPPGNAFYDAVVGAPTMDTTSTTTNAHTMQDTVARRKDPPGAAAADNNNNNNNNNNDDVFTNTIERILAASENRGESSSAPSSQHLEPFTARELSSLSALCTTQQEQASNRNNNNRSSSSFLEDADLGFADVDPSIAGQLVEGLQKHVTLASSIDFVQQGHQALQPNAATIEKWLAQSGRRLQGQISMGLEAAAILLFVINSPGIDRSVINEDAIEASIVLFRHHLTKNILPSLNQVGHITAAMGPAERAEAGRTPSSAASSSNTSAKKRRRSTSAAAAAAASSNANGSNSSSATIIRDMKKVYKPMYSTIGLTVQILERLEALVQKVPLDDQPLLNISSGALVSLELDPALQSDIAIAAHPIQEASLGVVTAIFRKYPRHRQIIVEDLFPLMLKLPAYKKSMRTYPIQSSSILFPAGLKTLSRSLAPGVTEGSNSGAGGAGAGAIQTMSAMILSLVQSAVIQPEIQSEQDPPPLPQPPQPRMEVVEENEEDHHPSISTTTPPQRFEMVSGLRNAQSVSDHFVALLLARCSKKGEDGGASEFRPILSNLIDDLLLVLLVPEYPAAEMLLISIANGITRHLQERFGNNNNNNNKTTTSAVETTYVNTVLDAFGKICAAEAKILKFHRERPVRIRSQQQAETTNTTTTTINGEDASCYCNKDSDSLSSGMIAMECGRCHSKYHAICVAMTKDTVPENWYCDACQLGRIVAFERDRNTNLGDLGCSPDLVDESYCMRRLLIDYLSIVTRNASGVVGFRDAYEFHLARWLSDLNRVQQQNHNNSHNKKQQAGAGGSAARGSDGGNAGVGTTNVWPLVTRLSELWDPRESSEMNTAHGQHNSLNGMLHCLSDEGRSRIMVHVACTQSQLLLSHLSQLGLFVNDLVGNKSSALLRKLSLKAIEKITDADPKLMIYPKVRNAVTTRFSDEAISVREAAVSLVGLYVVHSPAVANAFHPAFMVGLHDPGTSVRKRTIKMLQDILCTNPSYKGRAEACTAMLSLAADPKEEDLVRDAIYDLFLKVWLENGEEKVIQEVASPGSPEVEESLMSPGRKVLNMEFVNATGDLVPFTPTPQLNSTLSPLPTIRETRSTERRIKKRRLQIRSEIAAEQMVEVVKAADTGEHLTTLFRDLLDGESDADKGRKTSARRKRRSLAEGHCSMLVDAIFEILLRVEENRSSNEGATSKDVVAVIRTIVVFTSISPGDVHQHLDTLLPYLKADNGMSFQEEAVVVASLCDAVARVAPVMSKDELDELSTTSLADDLVKITFKFGREALSSAVRALSALAHHKEGSESSPFRAKILSLAKTFYGYLSRHRVEDDFASMKNKAKANVQRALSVLGAICRYHESSSADTTKHDHEDDEDVVSPDGLTFPNMASVFEDLFTDFLSKNDTQTKCAALRGLCGVFISQPREMLRMDQSGLITQVMAPDAALSLQLESLICWREILLNEESRIESGEAKKKMDSKRNITISKKISGDQDADATLFGGVLISHAPRLLQMTQVSDKKLRFAALDLVGHLLRQGQINPNETVPFLLALQGDVEEDGIRALALKLLMIEGEKRPDMLRQRVYAGIKQAYNFQKTVYPTKEHVSALVRISKGGTTQTECVFGPVFKECIASIRKQRRGLFSSLLRRFDLQNHRKKANGMNGSRSVEEQFIDDLPLLSFTAQVLAYLPYRLASDPLFIIYTINSALALRGPDLLDRLAGFLRPYGLCSTDEMDESNYDEDALEIAAKRELPHHAKEATRMLEPDFDVRTFSSLCAEAAAQTLLLRLKNFLRTAYDFNESRIFGFNPEAKDEKEKAFSKASQLAFDSKLSMEAVEGGDDMKEIDCMILQYAEFRTLMRAEANLDNNAMYDDDDDDTGPTRKRRLSTASAKEADDDVAMSP